MFAAIVRKYRESLAPIKNRKFEFSDIKNIGGEKIVESKTENWKPAVN